MSKKLYELAPNDTVLTSASDVPIPTVNNPTITITQGGTTKGSFTLNQSTGATIALDAGGGGSSSQGHTILLGDSLGYSEMYNTTFTVYFADGTSTSFVPAGERPHFFYNAVAIKIHSEAGGYFNSNPEFKPLCYGTEQQPSGLCFRNSDHLLVPSYSKPSSEVVDMYPCSDFTFLTSSSLSVIDNVQLIIAVDGAYDFPMGA